MSKRVVKVWAENYEVYAEWYVILTDASNKPMGLRLFNALVIYPVATQLNITSTSCRFQSCRV
jgi:hypothetical protein